MKKPITSHLKELTTIAELYYVQQLNQQQISDRIHIHRTEISRMLKEARELGIVQITINSGTHDIKELESFLLNTFNLRHTLVVPTNSSEQNTLDTLGLFAANYLSKLIGSNMTIGLSWGATIAKVIENYTNNKIINNINVVPLIGGPIGKLSNNYHANTLVHRLADKLDGNSETLDTPALISSSKLRSELMHNPNNIAVFNDWKQLDVALVGIGSSLITNKESWQAFYKDTNFSVSFNSDGAVGDILSQPFSIDGQPVHNFKQNIIGLNLSELKKVPYSIGIAEGKLKVNAIIGALKTHAVNTLITTDMTVIEIKRALQAI